jgi:hypothetical protein
MTGDLNVLRRLERLVSIGPLIAGESQALSWQQQGSKDACESARRAELAGLRSSASAAMKSWTPVIELLIVRRIAPGAGVTVLSEVAKRLMMISGRAP